MDRSRNTGIDLLRFICIYFVVCIHYVGWGGLSSSESAGIINMGIGGGLAVACNIAVNCFYMITGFFIKQDEPFSTCKKRILNIWVPTLFYSVVIPLALVLFNQITFLLKPVCFCFFPF